MAHHALGLPRPRPRFAAVLVLIALLMVGWFKSYITPLVVMAAIPFSLIGILPAHWAMGAFFTATSMIGFVAGEISSHLIGPMAVPVLCYMANHDAAS